MAATKLLPCTCDHAYQDRRYNTKDGKPTKQKRRVHNQYKEGWRCTVCRKEKRGD